jgi:purine-binding chemotaxis protein CheW
MTDNQPRPGSRGTAVNWSAIRRRLEASGDVLEAERSAGTDEANAILKSRARALAEPQLPETSDEDYAEVLEFLLAGETYAVETSFIRETFPLTDFTPLFCTPSFVTGIINVRGRIVSIVDLRRFFDLPIVGLSNLNRVILVRDESMEFGILADGITGISSLPLHGLQPSLPTLTGIREELTRGVTGERLVLLDMGKILADRRLVVHEEVD